MNTSRRHLHTLLATMALLLLLAPAAGSAQDRSLATIMEQLDADLGRLTSAMMVEDFDTIAKAAHAIAEHPAPGANERRQVMQRLGSDAPQFREQDQRVHRSATAMREAAEAQDAAGVLRHYQDTVGHCMTCHSQFRDRITSTNP